MMRCDKQSEIREKPKAPFNHSYCCRHSKGKWLTGITEFRIPAGKVCLFHIIDCYYGIPVPWSIGTSPGSGLASMMLEML